MNIDLTTDDLGAKRLAETVRLNATVAKVVETVCALHAVRAGIIRSPGDLFKKPHIVMARSHAAWLMNEEGLTSKHIAKALNMHQSAAIRAVRRWNDYKSGRMVTATEGQVWSVKAKIEQGMSVVEACAEVGVGCSKYDARATLMKAEGKL